MNFINWLNSKTWVYETAYPQERAIAIQSLKEKIQAQIYQFEVSPCPFCHLKKPKVLLDKDCYSIPSEFSLCKKCGCVYNSKRLNLDSMLRIYENEYRSIDRPNYDIELFFKHQRVKGERIWSFLNQNLNINNEKYPIVVEIGCGAGGILKEFKNKGYEVFGCDYNKEFLAYDHDLKDNLCFGNIEDLQLKLGKKKASIIIYEQVFEHLFDIPNEILKIQNISSDETLLFIGVPNFKNIHHHYAGNYRRFFQAFHLIHFTPSSLKEMLSQYGYSSKCMNKEIQSVFVQNNISSLNAKRFEYLKLYFYFVFLKCEYLFIKSYFKVRTFIRVLYV